MKSGIITKNGVFVPCDSWRHIGTAYQNNTQDQFISCKNEMGYGKSLKVLDIVGDLNKPMLEAMFDFATKNNINIDNVGSIDLEEALTNYSQEIPNA